MVATSEYKNDQKAYKMMNVSIVLFVLVIILTIWMYFYNKSIITQLEQTNLEISKVSQNIKKVNEDEKVKLYTLIKANNAYLEKYKYLSNIPLFVNKIKEISKIYKISFESFSYNEWQISTQAKVFDDSFSLASVKTKKFLEAFRKQENWIFDLWFISSFNWQDNISFWVKFEVK